jgi:hypothetical protein
MTTDHRFNNTKSNRRNFFFFFFFSRWLLHHACHLTPSTTDNTGNHRQDRKPPQNSPDSITENQKQTFFFFSHRRCSGLHKTRTTRYCPCGLAHTGSAAANKRKPTIDYPRIETSSDTMLRFVGGGNEMEATASLYYSSLFDLIQTAKYIG